VGVETARNKLDVSLLYCRQQRLRQWHETKDLSGQLSNMMDGYCVILLMSSEFFALRVFRIILQPIQPNYTPPQVLFGCFAQYLLDGKQ